VTTSPPAALRIGWRRSWIAPHLRRRLLAGILAAAGVLLALSAVHAPAAKVPVAAAPVRTTSLSGLETGLVAAPVRLADADLAPLLHPGMRVDVLVAGSTSDAGLPAAAEATVVARDVQVLSVGPQGSTSASSTNTSGGTLVVLAVTRSDAQALAGGEAAGRLSVSLLGS
jgi:pilus assembly protein CpaB